MAESVEEAKEQGEPSSPMDPTVEEAENMYIEDLDGLASSGESSEYEPPAEISLESLAGYGPRLSVGKFGMEEVVGDRVRGAVEKLERERDRRELLSRTWTEGENYKYRSQDEREAVEHLVQKAQRGTPQSEVKAEEEEDKGDLLTPEQRDELVERLFRGSYSVGGGKEGGVLGELRRMADVNGSYLPEDGERVVEKVRALMPAQGGQKVRKARV